MYLTGFLNTDDSCGFGAVPEVPDVGLPLGDLADFPFAAGSGAAGFGAVALPCQGSETGCAGFVFF